MANKIIEKIIEPVKVETGSNFLLKIKVQFIPSYQLITEANDNLITETEKNLITEGDFYE